MVSIEVASLLRVIPTFFAGAFVLAPLSIFGPESASAASGQGSALLATESRRFDAETSEAVMADNRGRGYESATYEVDSGTLIVNGNFIEKPYTIEQTEVGEIWINDILAYPLVEQLPPPTQLDLEIRDLLRSSRASLVTHYRKTGNWDEAVALYVARLRASPIVRWVDVQSSNVVHTLVVGAGTSFGFSLEEFKEHLDRGGATHSDGLVPDDRPPLPTRSYVSRLEKGGCLAVGVNYATYLPGRVEFVNKLRALQAREISPDELSRSLGYGSMRDLLDPAPLILRAGKSSDQE